MSSQTQTKNLPAHPPHHSTLPHPSQMLPSNPKTRPHQVRHNLPPSTPTISSRSTSHVLIPQIAPFPLHRPLQVPPPSSPPLHQAHLAKRAFLQSTSPRAATAITLRTLSSRAQTTSSRKSPLRLATLDGNLAAITCHRRLGVCALFIFFFHLVHLTFACLAPRPSRSDVLTPNPETSTMPRRDADFRDRRFGYLQGGRRYWG